MQTPGRLDPSSSQHLHHPAMETSVHKQQQPSASTGRNLRSRSRPSCCEAAMGKRVSWVNRPQLVLTLPRPDLRPSRATESWKIPATDIEWPHFSSGHFKYHSKIYQWRWTAPPASLWSSRNREDIHHSSLWEKAGEDKEFNSVGLELNTSDDRGIDSIWGPIRSSASIRTIFKKGFKLTILDKANECPDPTRPEHLEESDWEIYWKYQIFASSVTICQGASPPCSPPTPELMVLHLEYAEEKVNISEDGMKAFVTLSHGAMWGALNTAEHHCGLWESDRGDCLHLRGAPAQVRHRQHSGLDIEPRLHHSLWKYYGAENSEGAGIAW